MDVFIVHSPDYRVHLFGKAVAVIRLRQGRCHVLQLPKSRDPDQHFPVYNFFFSPSIKHKHFTKFQDFESIS